MTMMRMTVEKFEKGRTVLRDGTAVCAPKLGPRHGLKVGDEVEVELSGSEIIKVTDLDGRVLLHRDAIRREAERMRGAAERVVEQVDKFLDEGRERIEADYEGLPEVFQRRIDRFVAGKGVSWWWEYGSYELMGCADAVRMAEQFTPGFDPTDDEIAEWLESVDPSDIEGASDGHSGNTWGFAKRLAYLYLTNPEDVVREHGAMTPLVGCEEYGCTHGPPSRLITANMTQLNNLN